MAILRKGKCPMGRITDRESEREIDCRRGRIHLQMSLHYLFSLKRTVGRLSKDLTSLHAHPHHIPSTVICEIGQREATLKIRHERKFPLR